MKDTSKELLKLVKENPELPIIPATNYEVCAEDWGYWVGEISKIIVDYYYQDCEKWYAGEEDIKEHISNEIEDDYADMLDVDFEIVVDDKFAQLVEKGTVKEAIIMYIST